MELRNHQQTAFDRLRGSFRAGNRRILLVMPTGSGKTHTASHFIKSAFDKGRNVLFVAHRREILFQTEKKLNNAGITPGWIMAGKAKSAMSEVYLASIQTLLRRDHPAADLVIIDEAHHAQSASYKKLIANYPDAVIIGLTATPCRSDGRGLGAIFQDMIQVTDIQDQINRGYLVPVKVYAPARPDLRGVKITAGDYNEKQLGERMDKAKLVGDLVSHWEKYGKGRPTVIFATTIAHCIHIQEHFYHAGHIVEQLDGDTPGEIRKGILERLANGDTEIVVNCGVLTEGVDIPEIACIVLARPTRSFGLYIQMAGRGLRPSSGKENVVILDHAGAVYDHGLPTDPVEWTLDTNDFAFRKPRSKEKGAETWVCQNCFHVNPAGPSQSHCQECGLHPRPTAKGIFVGRGNLVEVQQSKRERKKNTEPKKVWTPQDKQKLWDSCLFKARSLGIKVGAAAHMYRNQVGSWPRGLQRVPKGAEWRISAAEFLEKA